MRGKLTILLLALFLPTALQAQDNRTLQNSFLDAEYFFFSEHYDDAVPIYLRLYDDMPDNKNIAYRIGVCYLNIDGQKERAVEYLETAVQDMSAKIKDGFVTQKAAPYDALYELGKAYSVNYAFSKAKETFLRYKNTLLPSDYDDMAFIDQEIRNCDNALSMINNIVNFTEVNIGSPINDDKKNHTPVISADGKTLAYMVTLKFYDAIMISRKSGDKWCSPINITPELQTDGDMYISCLSSDGSTLFLSKDDNFNSDIYTSTFNGSSWSPVTKLNKNINTKYWESHAFVTDDGNMLIFASDRPGGSGGLDLYISTKVNGNWGPAVNIGSPVNTSFNEDRPFLINGGRLLFFSSQGHQGLGGYDIFKSVLSPNNSWSDPENVGYPLNTPDDNIFFMPTDEGKSGYYSTIKEGVGFGNHDIYKIDFIP